MAEAALDQHVGGRGKQLLPRIAALRACNAAAPVDAGAGGRSGSSSLWHGAVWYHTARPVDMATVPTLWHITISHYSEKARWALDYKAIPYRLRAPLPGAHIPVALWLGAGRQSPVPVLDLGGQ